MNTEETSVKRKLSPGVVTEAAAWVARLHGPLRTPTVERGFRSWLHEHTDHARAFELVTDSWDEVAALKDGANIEVTLPSDRRDPTVPRRWVPLALAAVVGVFALAGVLWGLYLPGVSTGVGEQRVLALEDGTRVHLNTSTRVVVDYTEGRRHIRLKTGEAFFEVARRPQQPFVVSVGERQVQALGTAFLVRHDDLRTAITLMEGKVAVASSLLEPGERLTFVEGKSPVRDQPSVAMLTAWQRGKVAIDNLTLAEAAAEMNRYSERPLIVGPAVAELRVSGIFRAGDSVGFAGAVARNYGLRVRESSRRIVLSGLEMERQ